MDKYENVIKKGKFCFTPPLPGRQVKTPPLPGRQVESLTLSFDRFGEFLDRYQYNLASLPLLQEITIYDEGIITNQDQVNMRYRFLKLINEINYNKLCLYLSDSTMPFYNKMMSHIGWKGINKTEIQLKTDRNPIQSKNLFLEDAQGKLSLTEEKLIWCSNDTLKRLHGKVEETILQNSIKLKDVIGLMNLDIMRYYYLNDFTDFDKVWFMYDYITKNIRFAGEATYFKDGKQHLKKDPNYHWVSEPLGTYEHKSGVCEGQARLMQILLNNPFMRCDTVTISGRHPIGSHAWSGTVIDDKLYQTCLTMRNPLQKLENKGYVANDIEVYPRIYQTAELSQRDIANIQDHIRRLKK